MEFDSLTDAQKTVLLYWQDQLLRPLIGEFAKWLIQAKEIDLYQDGQVSAILASLDPAAVIPNQSGLAGTKALTAGNLATFDAALENIEGTYNTEALRGLMIAIAGPENTI